MAEGHVSASQAAVAAGISTHVLPRSLWEVQCGLVEKISHETEAIRHGHIHEDLVRQRYAERMGFSVSGERSFKREELAQFSATPDGVVLTADGMHIVEIKSPLHGNVITVVVANVQRIGV
jgi:predicted phage-related endonuclease